MTALTIHGEPLPNIPWEPRPADSGDVLWRYSQNPVVPARAIRASSIV